MKKALSYLLIFIGIQLLGGAIIQTVWSLVTHNSDKTAAMLITLTAICAVLVIVVFLWTRFAVVSPKWLRTRPWTVLAWSVVASLGALIPSIWMQEQMPELPNLMENEFDTILGTPWGYLTIGLLAPLSEEIVMRGAILKELLKSQKLSVWGAIAISAAMFALIHMNPAQMPHAFIIGLLLGWMYWRTGSILPGVAYHWSVDIFKGSEMHVVLAVFFSLLILLPAIYQLHLNMKRADER